MTPEKITFTDMSDFAQNLFIRALVLKQNELGLKNITQVCPNTPGKPYDIVLTVNGVQLPFKEALEGLRESLGDMDNAQVSAWVREKFDPFSELIHKFEEDMKYALEHLLDKQFPNRDRREE